MDAHKAEKPTPIEIEQHPFTNKEQSEQHTKHQRHRQQSKQKNKNTTTHSRTNRVGYVYTAYPMARGPYPQPSDMATSLIY